MRQLTSIEMQAIAGVRRAFAIFDGNYRELKQILVVLTETLYGIVMRDQLNSAIEDLSRRLHNFVAAAVSLIEHTENLHNDLYARSGVFQDYWQERSRVFTDDPMAQFVKQLRNYCAHFAVVVPIHQIRIVMGTSSQEPSTDQFTLLKVSDLRRYNKWSVKAKVFMDGKDTIDLVEVVDRYTDKVNRFYTWYWRRQQEVGLALNKGPESLEGQRP
jgi:hypothetical protein